MFNGPNPSSERYMRPGLAMVWFFKERIAAPAFLADRLRYAASLDYPLAYFTIGKVLLCC